MAEKKQPRINFEEERHLYTTDDGVVVPSVTQIIKMFSKPSFYADNGAKELGTAIHRMLELYDKGELIQEFYPDHYLEHLKHYELFLRDLEPKWTGIECPIYHEDLGYAGMVDRCGIGIESMLLVDIKTGSSIPAWANLQTAAYAMAMYDDYEIVTRAVVQIHPKRLKSYKIKVYNDPYDFVQWAEMCKQYNDYMRNEAA